MDSVNDMGFPQELSWDKPEQVQASLNALYFYANDGSDQFRSWYLGKIKTKRKAALFTRLGAILLTTGAGIIPMLSAIPSLESHSWLHPAWSSVALALAALLIALDKLSGYTSGWIRYTLVEQQLRQKQQQFCLNWQQVKGRESALPLVTDYLNETQQLVHEETQQWAKEFQQHLSQLDKATLSAGKR
ncbi:DUF4231 domain-containing protein [Corallincola platygyrae]|uniref:DUF4231 domain-containing protein n=1 Tax=Corallincola platygyrae TaxID=1193278 RepID=A0ABW4XSV9_9GAMM